MPRPLSFFTWITALAVVILVAAPFSQPPPGQQGVHRDHQPGRRGGGHSPAVGVARTAVRVRSPQSPARLDVQLK